MRSFPSGIFVGGTPRGHSESKSSGLYSKQASFFETTEVPARIGQFVRFWIIDREHEVGLVKIFRSQTCELSRLPMINLDDCKYEVLPLSKVGSVVAPAVPRDSKNEKDRVVLGCRF